MLSHPIFKLIPVFALALAGGLAVSPEQAGAQSGETPISRPLEPGAAPVKRDRVDPPTPDQTSGQTPGKPGASSASGIDGLQPSQGVTVFERMGAALPELPPEKPYTGPVDEAYGAYQRGYYLTALDKALPRAQKGDAAAQTLVAEMMTRGLGVKLDRKAAAFWYGQAANGGDPAALFKYALLLMEGRDVAKDKAKADQFMQKAADAGNAEAQFNWAQIVVTANPGENGLRMALPYYEKSAEHGIADAQYAVAQLYMTIKDIEPDKKATARDWLVRSARAGFDTAQLDMGVWLVNGIGGPRDYADGFNWLKVAANRGNVVAQNKLAHLYINALGTKPDPIEAAKWYVLSRRAGLKDPVLEDFYLGIDDDQQKKAIEAANGFRRG